MFYFDNPSAAQHWCTQQRAKGNKVGFVPTMGALHDGHLSLLHAAKENNDVVCASIFVNPLQFNNTADLNLYPCELKSDSKKFASVGCHMLFTGTLFQFFPQTKDLDMNSINRLDPGEFGQGLEGEHRPGHLAGVCTIVNRLFSIVGPCQAYFGEKDFQQSLVVRSLASKHRDITVTVCPTIREKSGLAMSSRNQLLDKKSREEAAIIYQSLQAAKQNWQLGEHRSEKLSQVMRQGLDQAKLTIDYATVKDPNNWSLSEPDKPLLSARAFIAVEINKVRLIDNLKLD